MAHRNDCNSAASGDLPRKRAVRGERLVRKVSDGISAYPGSLPPAPLDRYCPRGSAGNQLMGFWISVPLAVVSLTGVYLSFPWRKRRIGTCQCYIVTPNSGRQPALRNLGCDVGSEAN